MRNGYDLNVRSHHEIQIRYWLEFLLRSHDKISKGDLIRFEISL